MIRKVLVLLTVWFVGLALQATAAHTISPYAIVPDVVLILAMYLGLHLQNPAGAIAAFVVGLGGDFASAQFIGPGAAGALVAYLLTVICSRKIYAEHMFTQALLAIFCSFAKSAVYIAMVDFYINVSMFSADVLRGVAIEAGLTAAVAPLVIKLLNVASDWAITTPQFQRGDTMRMAARLR